MSNADDMQGISAYWGRDNLGQKILDALVATGKNLDTLTIDDLALFDQFHSGGKAATQRLARLAALSPGMRVLDVGGGLGGPARTLAVEFGCQVTVVDLTESYVQAAEMLTQRLGLGERVTHRVGNALDLPADLDEFDVVWTQNSGMNIADKERLYTGFQRVLRPGGWLVFQEPMAGPVEPVIYPTMWSRDASNSFLRTPEEMQRVIEAAGFQRRALNLVPMLPRRDITIPNQGRSIVDLVMGAESVAIEQASERNVAEHRMVMVHAVFQREP